MWRKRIILFFLGVVLGAAVLFAFEKFPTSAQAEKVCAPDVGDVQGTECDWSGDDGGEKVLNGYQGNADDLYFCCQRGYLTNVYVEENNIGGRDTRCCLYLDNGVENTACREAYAAIDWSKY